MKSRFVILHHQLPPGSPRPNHWDFLLESGARCRTWALSEQPCADRWIRAEALPDHRLHYLTYEGPVSRGRGQVRRWDQGEFAWQEDTPSGVTVWLDGIRFSGQVRGEPIDDGDWRFRFTAIPPEKRSRKEKP